MLSGFVTAETIVKHASASCAPIVVLRQGSPGQAGADAARSSIPRALLLRLHKFDTTLYLESTLILAH
jgi:hypothetical protein